MIYPVVLLFVSLTCSSVRIPRIHTFLHRQHGHSRCWLNLGSIPEKLMGCLFCFCSIGNLCLDHSCALKLQRSNLQPSQQALLSINCFPPHPTEQFPRSAIQDSSGKFQFHRQSPRHLVRPLLGVCHCSYTSFRSYPIQYWRRQQCQLPRCSKGLDPSLPYECRRRLESNHGGLCQY